MNDRKTVRIQYFKVHLIEYFIQEVFGICQKLSILATNGFILQGGSCQLLLQGTTITYMMHSGIDCKPQDEVHACGFHIV